MRKLALILCAVFMVSACKENLPVEKKNNFTSQEQFQFVHEQPVDLTPEQIDILNAYLNNEAGTRVVTITSDTHHDFVNSTDEVVVIYFWASWCGPCRAYAPIVENAENQRIKARFGRINVDDQESLAKMYNVVALPHTFILKNAQIMRSWTGLTSLSFLLSNIDSAGY